jgi:hypothetical protein
MKEDNREEHLASDGNQRPPQNRNKSDIIPVPPTLNKHYSGISENATLCGKKQRGNLFKKPVQNNSYQKMQEDPTSDT